MKEVLQSGAGGTKRQAGCEKSTGSEQQRENFHFRVRQMLVILFDHGDADWQLAGGTIFFPLQ
jgi:hypothetical protein